MGIFWRSIREFGVRHEGNVRNRPEWASDTERNIQGNLRLHVFHHAISRDSKALCVPLIPLISSTVGYCFGDSISVDLFPPAGDVLRSRHEKVWLESEYPTPQGPVISGEVWLADGAG